MFCHKCGAKIAEGAAFCHKCGTKIEYEDTEPQASNSSGTNEPASDAHSQSNTHSHNTTLQCPNCNSTDIMPITETTTDASGGGYKVGKGCCGWILFGPLGLLCGLCGTGVKTQTQTRTYWVCKSCGNKFRSSEDVKVDEKTYNKREADKMSAVSGCMLTGSLFLWIIGKYFSDHDISFLGIPNGLYITLGIIGMVLGVLTLIMALVPGVGDIMDKSSEGHKQFKMMLLAFLIIISVISLIGGIIIAIVAESLFAEPAWFFILLGSLGMLLFAFLARRK